MFKFFDKLRLSTTNVSSEPVIFDTGICTASLKVEGTEQQTTENMDSDNASKDVLENIFRPKTPPTFKKATPKKVPRQLSKLRTGTDWRSSSNHQAQGVVAKLEHILEHQLFADVTFYVGNSREVVKCHSLVLKMQSKHFENMLAGDKVEFEVPTTSPDVFKKMLKYLYSDKLEFNAEDALDALVLARQYQLPTLQSKCGKIVLEGVDVDNAGILLRKAEDMGDKQLSLKVQEFILRHASQVVETPAFAQISLSSLIKLLQVHRALWNMSEVKILEAVKVWASAECDRQGLAETGPNMNSVAKEALDLIQFSQFTPKQFNQQVVKPKLLPNDKMLEIQSELIDKMTEKDQNPRFERLSQSSHEETILEDVATSSVSSSDDMHLPRSSSEGSVVVNGEKDDEDSNYHTDSGHVYTLSRYSNELPKDFRPENADGAYKINLTASETVNLVGFSLYGHANGDPTPVDVVVRLVSSDEETTFYEFETHEELPEQGGEFEVQLPEPFTIRAMDGYTFIVSVNGRVFPVGTGGKRTYDIPTRNGKNITFKFKNSKDVAGATHVRGQLPKIRFSIPPPVM